MVAELNGKSRSEWTDGAWSIAMNAGGVVILHCVLSDDNGKKRRSVSLRFPEKSMLGAMRRLCVNIMFSRSLARQ